MSYSSDQTRNPLRFLESASGQSTFYDVDSENSTGTWQWELSGYFETETEAEDALENCFFHARPNDNMNYEDWKNGEYKYPRPKFGGYKNIARYSVQKIVGVILGICQYDENVAELVLIDIIDNAPLTAKKSVELENIIADWESGTDLFKMTEQWDNARSGMVGVY